MKRLFAIALLLAGAAARAQSDVPQVTAHIQPDSVMIGDRFDLMVDVEKDLVQVVQFPEFEDKPGSAIELYKEHPVDTLERDGRHLKLRKRYTLAAFEEGKWNLGRPAVLYADKNIVDTLWTRDSLYLQVATFQIDSTSQSIYDVKPQWNLPFRFGEVSGYAQWGALALVLLLAAAYALDGNRKVAEELTAQGGSGQTGKVDPYDDTYNSSERQMAVVLMTQTLLGKREEAFRTALKMSDILKKEKWLSTQSTAWMLSTLSNFIVSGQTGIDAKAGKESIRTDKSFVSMPLTEETGVTNNGKESLYAVVSQRYNPAKGEETEAADNIRISVRYTDMDGKAIDPRSIRASTDFYAVVTVSNISGYEKYTNLALTHIVPAGWEITSERDLTSVTYQDIRDDRVLSYFDLKRGESKEIPVKLTATYKGRYYLPSIYCEAMYDNSVRALKKGEWIEVVE